MRVATWVRRWCGILAGVAFVIGWNLHADPAVFNGAPYDAVRDLASLEGWAAAWFAIAVFAAIAAVTRRPWAWHVAAIGTMGVAPIWMTSLLYARFILDTRISFVGIALWTWLVGSNLIAVMEPRAHQLASKR